MKRTILLVAVAGAALALTGCAGTVITQPDGTKTIDLTQGKVEKATHAGFVAAAKYATDNGFPERAQVRLAQDALLTAAEAQASACANAVLLEIPKPPADVDGAIDPILAAEMAEEAVASFSGFSKRVKALCAAIPVPTMPVPLLPAR